MDVIKANSEIQITKEIFFNPKAKNFPIHRKGYFNQNGIEISVI
jgi:hypothetical protein